LITSTFFLGEMGIRRSVRGFAKHNAKASLAPAFRLARGAPTRRSHRPIAFKQKITQSRIASVREAPGIPKLLSNVAPIAGFSGGIGQRERTRILHCAPL